MSIVTEFIREHGLEELCKRYHIKAYHHSTLPLIILIYDNRNASKSCPYASICRGIVIEKNTGKIVSQGMSRFFNYVPGSLDLNKDVIVETKEDGTLVHLFCYDGKWILSTRHNFADDKVGFSDLTYLQLFEKISGKTIQEIGEKLNPDITYCLELCSIQNRIIRKYNNASIFLLGCYKNGLKVDIDVPMWNRPERKTIKIKEINKVLDEYISKDPLFEGLVIKTSDSFWKVKSRFYLTIHKLKYRGWKVALPRLVVPILLKYSNRLNLIYELFPERELPEYQKRFKFYQDILNEEYKHIYESTSQFNFLLNKCKSSTDLSKIWSNSETIILNKLFKNNHDPFIDYKHPRKYCSKNMSEDEDSGICKNLPKLINGEWNVECYCGNKMYFEILKTDNIAYKECCGVYFDTFIYSVGTPLWICHTCNSKIKSDYNRNPISVPCSKECFNLKLAIKELDYNIDVDYFDNNLCIKILNSLYNQ